MSYKFRSALVTGGWGFIGSALVKRLVEKGVEVVVVDINGPSHFFEILMPKVKWIRSSVEDLKDDLSLEGIDSVFHLAGRANVKASIEDPIGDFEANVVQTLSILEWSRQHDVKRFVFSSSVSVCDRFQLCPFTEDTLVRPSSAYGAAKTAGEAYCSAFARSYGLHTVIARFFNLYGPFTTRLFVADISEMILNGQKQLALWGGGRQIRDYLHVNDAVDGLILLCEKGALGEVYNIASGVPVTLAELAKKIAYSINGQEAEIVERGPTYPGDILEWFADIEKAKALGFKLRYSLEEGLKEFASWLKINQDYFLSNKK